MARGRPQPDVSPRRSTRGKAQSAAVASAGSLDPAQLWRSLVRHSPDRIVLLDRSGRILYTNHTGASDSVELVVGSRFEAQAATPFRATLRRTLTQLFREGGGQPAHFGIPGVGTSALRWWDGHALPVVERGKVAAVLLVCRDVTERRHTEEALRIQEAQLAEAQGLAHIGSWERNLNDETATWSEELYRIFGLTQSTNLVGRARFYELIHPDDRQRVKQAIEHGVESHEPLNVTHRILRHRRVPAAARDRQRHRDRSAVGQVPRVGPAPPPAGLLVDADSREQWIGAGHLRPLLSCPASAHSGGAGADRPLGQHRRRRHRAAPKRERHRALAGPAAGPRRTAAVGPRAGTDRHRAGDP